MSTAYTIYLVNHSVLEQHFWCFLSLADQFIENPGVYANSSAALLVAANDLGTNKFIVPMQYEVGAGASNIEVGLGVRVVSGAMAQSGLGQGWLASFVDAPPNLGRTIAAALAPPPQSIAISTNAFDLKGNSQAHWYGNLSVGLATDAGFSGMTWAPLPETTWTLTPRMTFAIAIGDYAANSLVSWKQLLANSAQLAAPGDFDQNGACSVTLGMNGTWTVAPGRP